MHKRLRERKRGIEGMKSWKLETLIEIGQKKERENLGVLKEEEEKEDE